MYEHIWSADESWIHNHYIRIYAMKFWRQALCLEQFSLFSCMI